LKKPKISDWLFVSQIAFGLPLIIAQALKMFTSVQGMTIVLFICFEVFVVFNLFLAHQAHKEVPSRTTKQTLIIYYVWLVGTSSHLLILMYFGSWTSLDSWMILTLLILSAAGIIYQKIRGSGIKDPMTRGYLALCAKTLPQIYLAYCIFRDGGGDGLSVWTVWCGHLTTFTRVGILMVSGRKSGWNSNIVGSLVSETGNSISWWIVTFIWLFI